MLSVLTCNFQEAEPLHRGKKLWTSVQKVAKGCLVILSLETYFKRSVLFLPILRKGQLLI